METLVNCVDKSWGNEVIMNKTIYYYASRGSNKRLTALQKINEYLKLGYNIVVVPFGEQGVSRGKKSKQLYIDGEYFDLNEE